MDTSSRAPDTDRLSASTIGEELTITGNVTSKGKLHLNGRIQGDVHCVALVLGENAQRSCGASDGPGSRHWLDSCANGDVGSELVRRRQRLSQEPLYRTGHAF